MDAQKRRPRQRGLNVGKAAVSHLGQRTKSNGMAENTATAVNETARSAAHVISDGEGSGNTPRFAREMQSSAGAMSIEDVLWTVKTCIQDTRREEEEEGKIESEIRNLKKQKLELEMMRMENEKSRHEMKRPDRLLHLEEERRKDELKAKYTEKEFKLREQEMEVHRLEASARLVGSEAMRSNCTNMMTLPAQLIADQNEK